MYPPFRHASGDDSSSEEETSSEEDETSSEDVTDSDEEETKRSTTKFVQKTTQKRLNRGSVAIPPGITQDEIANPDVQKNLFSFYYVSKKHKMIEQSVQAKIAQGERLPASLKEANLSFMR